MEKAIDILKDFHFTNSIWALAIPCSLMALDILTGYLNAWVKHEVKSSRMRQGLAKKCGEIIVLVVGKLLEYGLTLPSYLMSAISAYIMIMELWSIVENLDSLGVPIPKFLKRGLGNMENTINGDDDNGGEK
jgi:toxin secretion/phage lysis holin